MTPTQYYKWLIEDKQPEDSKMLIHRRRLLRSLGVVKQLDIIKMYPGVFTITSLISPSSKRTANKIDALFNEDCNWLSYINVTTIKERIWSYMLRNYFENTKYHCTWDFSRYTWNHLIKHDPMYSELRKYANLIDAETIDQYIIMAKMEL